MSERAMLLALAERCETVDGPDRVVDEAIYRAVGYWWDSGEAEWCAPDSPRAAEGVDIPAFTASLDAALPNEGDGYWQVSGPHPVLSIPLSVSGRWLARLIVRDGAAEFVGCAATEPLARRAAALRARAMEAGNGE